MFCKCSYLYEKPACNIMQKKRFINATFFETTASNVLILKNGKNIFFDIANKYEQITAK